MSPPPSVRSARITRSSVPPPMAAIGLWDSAAGRACRVRSFRACAGRALRHSPTHLPACRATCAWHFSRRSRMSTMPRRTDAGARRSVAGGRLQMLLEAWHELDEIAGTVAIVELVPDDVFPAIAAGAGRARQRKEIRAAGDPGSGTALDRRCAHLLVAEPAEELA